jgi:hypothetical protein
MVDLEFELKQLCYRNKDGSHVTQAQRRMRLMQAARDLDRLGYQNLKVRSLKPKHVHALVADWRERGLSAGTVKNRMADLRWWAEKIGKRGVVEPSNDAYGLARRVYVTNQQRAFELQPEQLATVSDRHLRMSLRLQAAFGLGVAKKRSSSAPPGPTAASTSPSRPPGARADARAPSRAAQSSSAPCLTKPASSPSAAR